MCLEGIYGSFHNFLGRFHPHPLSAAPDSSLYYTQQKSLAVRTTINHTILLTKILNYELNHNLIPKPYQTRRFILLREHKKMYNILYMYLYHGKSIRYVLYSKDHQNSTKVFILVVKYQL